jgi:MarR family transcriptional regulator, temperature-dependent positive regulator of motility
MKHRSANGLDRSPVHLLHRAYQLTGDVFKAEVKIEGLTPRQLATLLAVAENEGLSQTDLVERTGIDRSTMADITRRLISRRLLTRRRTKDDARTYAVKLTDEGSRVLRTVAPQTKAVDERVLNSLAPARRDQFVSALLELVGTLEGMARKPTV